MEEIQCSISLYDMTPFGTYRATRIRDDDGFGENNFIFTFKSIIGGHKVIYQDICDIDGSNYFENTNYLSGFNVNEFNISLVTEEEFRTLCKARYEYRNKWQARNQTLEAVKETADEINKAFAKLIEKLST